MATTAEQRAYSKGYQAGRKKLGIEYDGRLRDAEREQFRREAALTALQGMMLPGNNWGSNRGSTHKPYRTMEEYAAGAFAFADELCKRTHFTGLLIKPTVEEPSA